MYLFMEDPIIHLPYKKSIVLMSQLDFGDSVNVTKTTLCITAIEGQVNEILFFTRLWLKTCQISYNK